MYLLLLFTSSRNYSLLEDASAYFLGKRADFRSVHFWLVRGKQPTDYVCPVKRFEDSKSLVSWHLLVQKKGATLSAIPRHRAQSQKVYLLVRAT